MVVRSDSVHPVSAGERWPSRRPEDGEMQNFLLLVGHEPVKPRRWHGLLEHEPAGMVEHVRNDPVQGHVGAIM